MELGSEYNLSLSELNKVDCNLFSYLSTFPEIGYLDSGRSAIRCFSSRLREEDEVLLPEFICESVINCFKNNRIFFYKINYDFSVDIEDLRRHITGNTRAIFLMHYFGALQPADVLCEISKLAEEHGIMILEDVTHSLFSLEKTIGNYMVASIRKWMPIPQGGVLYTTEKAPANIQQFEKSTNNERTLGMVLKDLYLNGVMDCNREYRAIFANIEEQLNQQCDIYRISDFAEYIISCIDVNELIQKRKSNYQYLSVLLKKQGIEPAIKLQDSECPFVFLLRISERDKFRKYLMDNRIYCAVHWPFDGIMEKERALAIANAQELISLPIDQRYNETHMEYLADVISRYGGDLLF